MKTHQGYTAGEDGAVCSACGDLIEPGDDAVLMDPAEIQETGSANPKATAIHGVLHVSCFEQLTVPDVLVLDE